ncbi:MAG: metalloprotease family protein [Butyribacter sp.]|nr:metalloprotease family protein [bacterium]MDY3854122.1 metalloprotease family protein [Butyribacter sp.]
MQWDNEFLIPLYNALLIPAAVFGIGLIVEWIGGLLTTFLGMLFGGKIAFFIRNRLTFIGTVHHELAHALFAWISGAKVTKVELFHVRGEQLGCVEFYPRGNTFTKAIQMMLASIAPVVCGAVSLCVLSWFWCYRCTLTWHYILTGYLMVSILFHMNMSSQDIKNAWKGMPLTMLICYIIFYVTKISFIG